jgi:hypothetical protein
LWMLFSLRIASHQSGNGIVMRVCQRHFSAEAKIASLSMWKARLEYNR